MLGVRCWILLLLEAGMRETYNGVNGCWMSAFGEGGRAGCDPLLVVSVRARTDWQ